MPWIKRVKWTMVGENAMVKVGLFGIDSEAWDVHLGEVFGSWA